MTEIIKITPKKTLIDIHAILKRIPYSRSTIYRLCKAGEFPESIKIGRNRVAWLERDVDQWIEDRVNGKSSPVMDSTNVIDFSPKKSTPVCSNNFANSMGSANAMVSNTA